MVYYPYFRGKQFELLAIRESARIMAGSNFVPIIEPVRESLTTLTRALQSIRDAGGRAVVVTNPRYGDHRGGSGILTLLETEYPNDDAITAGILLQSDTDPQSAIAELTADAGRAPVLIHDGFTEPAALAKAVPGGSSITNVFVDDQANTLYRRHFSGHARIIMRDGFEQMRNADYLRQPVQTFSDLHVIFRDLSMDGYGDFLTVGDAYSEGGGPAYAVALHLTFIDNSRDSQMFIEHFVSDTNDTPTDPAGKFAQALGKLIQTLNVHPDRFEETSAIMKFRELHERQHFPGLGTLKKLSMIHHIETLAQYHATNG